MMFSVASTSVQYLQVMYWHPVVIYREGFYLSLLVNI